MAEGRQEQPNAEVDTLCDEMQALERAHEQLRTKPQRFAAGSDKEVSA